MRDRLIGLCKKAHSEWLEKEYDVGCLKAELEDLKSQFHELDIECSRLERAEDKKTAEIERLRAECESQSVLWSKYYESIFESAKEAVKDETAKEFAERVFMLFPADKNHTTISRLTIKQILKEMTK